MPVDAPPDTPDNDPKDTQASRRQLIQWLWRIPVLAALGGGAYGVYEAYNVHFNKRRPNPNPVFEAHEPQVISSLEFFGQAWDDQEFVYAGIPAIALRLPEPIPGGLSVGEAHFAAFSRVCTHQGCIVKLNKDLEAVAFAFNYRTDEPALVCRCHLSVFDPEKSGQAMSGPAVRPLQRIELASDGKQLLATGVERL